MPFKTSVSILDHFRQPQHLGFRHSAAAAAWASTHFPIAQRPVAALLAGILVEQVGNCLDELRPSSDFNRDIGVFDYFDASDYTAAVEEQFQLSIPEQERQRIQRFSDLVQYVESHSNNRNA